MSFNLRMLSHLLGNLNSLDLDSVFLPVESREAFPHFPIFLEVDCDVGEFMEVCAALEKD